MHSTQRPEPSHTTQAQRAARSDRLQRPAAAEGRSVSGDGKNRSRLASNTSAVPFLGRGRGLELSQLHSANVQVLKALLAPGHARSRPGTAEPRVPWGHARSRKNPQGIARASPLRLASCRPAGALPSHMALAPGPRRPNCSPGLAPGGREHRDKRRQSLHDQTRLSLSKTFECTQDMHETIECGMGRSATAKRQETSSRLRGFLLPPPRPGVS